MQIGRIAYFAPASLAEASTTNALRNSSSETSLRFKDAFIPETSKWGKKPLCIDEFDENPNCCASGYDIEAIVDQAYEDDLQDHPGVMAIENRPCVHSGHLESLADELAIMAPYEPELGPGNIPGAPKWLNLKQEVTKAADDTDISTYCKKLVHNVLSASYGTMKSIPQKVALGENFRAVTEYCGKVAIADSPLFLLLTNRVFYSKKP